MTGVLLFRKNNALNLEDALRFQGHGPFSLPTCPSRPCAPHRGRRASTACPPRGGRRASSHQTQLPVCTVPSPNQQGAALQAWGGGLREAASGWTLGSSRAQSVRRHTDEVALEPFYLFIYF